jgi:chromosome segregation ATPase
MDLISWKHSFKRLNEEYETARKKRQALDSLLDNGKISQSTHGLFAMEIAEAITDIERQQKTLLQKMNAKMIELEEQVKSLEILLANFEIQHVVGEVDDEVYQREINVLSMGLETSRQELAVMKEAVEQLTNGNVVAESDVEPQMVESGPVNEKVDETVVEIKVAERDSAEAEQEALEEAKESQSLETTAEMEEQPKA